MLRIILNTEEAMGEMILSNARIIYSISLKSTFSFCNSLYKYNLLN